MSIYDHSLSTIDGEPAPLSQFEGRVLLVINVASECGFTKQYTGLQALHEKYEGQGLLVLGLPCNDFGAQEPGTDAEVKEFCETNYSVSFPLFSKVGIKSEPHPLYQDLQDRKGKVDWNFNKFLVSREGEVLAHFAGDVEPDSAELTRAIEGAL
jgi:glutathione peroxidase